MNKVLIVDDSKSIRKILHRALISKGFQLEEAEDAFIAEEKVTKFKPNVILLDLNLPGKTGIELCKELKENIKTQNIYIIMLTASTTEEDESFGFQAGADDYICKPFELERLLARVERGLNENKTREDALYDTLTKLYNRRFFETYIKQEKSRIERYNRKLSVLLLDIDHFKRVNDTYGHNAGDSVLREMAELLINNSRVSDIPVRWGGEELLLLMPETSSEDAFNKANEIREKIANKEFKPTDGITVSIGVAEYRDGSDFISEADKALYKAKENGRNRVEKI